MMEPNQCVILAIDPGKHDGAALIAPWDAVPEMQRTSAPAFIHGSWCLTTPEMRDAIVELAQAFAYRCAIPLMVVGEKWTPGGYLTFSTVIGLGAAWERWKMVLEARKVPRSRVIRVYPPRWRSGLGIKGRKSEDLKAGAMRHIKAAWHVTTPNADVAEALCIAHWALFAPEVAAKIPKNRRG